jgi:putative tryptophan/tyrosine transport system substrate-binding protein
MHFDRLRRRKFIALLGGAVAWPLGAGAQQSGKLPKIGMLGSSAAAFSHWLPALLQRLRELDWIENRTLAIEYRWTEGHNERYAATCRGALVRLKVDVIVALGSPAIVAAKRATAIIPIVFPIASDPVGEGLVASFARPGGNITGLSNEQPDLAGKRLEILRELVPGLSRLGYIANVNNPTAIGNVHEVEAASAKLALQIMPLDIKRAEDVAPAIETLKGRAQALYVVGDPLIADNQMQINTLALAARLPTMHGSRGYVASGGLLSYGPDYSDLFRRAGDYVDKILKGAKPADIPVELPTRIELVVNLKTAKAIELKIPETFLVRADEMIE